MLTTSFNFLCLSEPPSPPSVIPNPSLLSTTTPSHFLRRPPKPSAALPRFSTAFSVAAQAEAQVESRADDQMELEEVDLEVVEGFTATQFCDRIIDLFLNEKTRVKDWRKYLVFREEWNKYRERFYRRCRARADAQNDEASKQKYIALGRKVKRVDEEMERHHDLLKEVEDSPADIDALVARRRKDFTGGFFSYLTLLSEAYDALEDRDGTVPCVI